jgi:hypothetical protein
MNGMGPVYPRRRLGTRAPVIVPTGWYVFLKGMQARGEKTRSRILQSAVSLRLYLEGIGRR